MIKVSVISPIYNREQWVENLLNNLQAQTLKEIEFIIIDDGSSDKTYSKLKRKTGKDKRFVLLKSATNQGPYHARNMGLIRAKGEYIGFFDCDDKIPVDYFQSLYEQAKTAAADIIYTSFNNNLHLLTQIKAPEDKFKVLKNGAIWDKLYKRDYLQANDIRFEEGLYTADNLFILQAFMRTDKIIITTTPVYEYSLQNDSIGIDISKKKKRQKDIINVLQKAIELGKQNNLSGETERELKYFLQRSLWNYPKDKAFQRQFCTILGIEQTLTKEVNMRLKILKFIRFFHLISKEKYNQKRYIELVKISDLFDNKWYLAQNPDVRAQKIGAAKHYVKYGWKEGRNPSPKFDGNKYLSDYPEVAAKGICPLVHYIISGRKEGRYYSSVNGEVNQPKIDEMNWYGKLRYALEYPIRLQEECDRLKAEIKMLEDRG